MVKRNVLERLLASSSHEHTDDECWICNYTPHSPRGHIMIRRDDMSRVGIHRVAWEAHNAEPIPEGMVVMHTCDNPACFNPNHLVVGTQQENLQDMCRKNRHRWRNHTPGRRSHGEPRFAPN